MTSVRSRIVTVTATASTGSASVVAATRECIASKWTARTPRVTTTATVWQAHVFVRRDGRVWIVVRWTRRLCNVCRTVLGTVHLTLKLSPASVNLCGRAAIAPVLCVTRTVVLMVIAWAMLVFVILVGRVNIVTCSNVIQDATSTANARTAPVSVLPVGTANIAP
uniref:Uncharacterized protein n=1 Tax=Cacopsylla melanoneura TaxID=428564 RepID=A0A8D8W5X3_9HEMI